MRLYIPINRHDPERRQAELDLREAAGGEPFAEGHCFEVGDVADLRAARDKLAERLPVAWPLFGAALLPSHQVGSPSLAAIEAAEAAERHERLYQEHAIRGASSCPT